MNHKIDETNLTETVGYGNRHGPSARGKPAVRGKPQGNKIRGKPLDSRRMDLVAGIRNTVFMLG